MRVLSSKVCCMICPLDGVNVKVSCASGLYPCRYVPALTLDEPVSKKFDFRSIAYTTKLRDLIPQCSTFSLASSGVLTRRETDVSAHRSSFLCRISASSCSEKSWFMFG